MVNIRQFEAKKGVGGTRRYTEAKSQAGAPSKNGHDLRLVGVERVSYTGRCLKRALRSTRSSTLPNYSA